MKSASFPLHLIITILAQLSLSIESCSPEEDKISVSVTTEFLEQSVLSASIYTKTVSSSSSFKESLNQLSVSAAASGSFGALFSASASASYESLKNDVTSMKKYEENEQSKEQTFDPDQLQIVQDTQTTVTINGKSASVSKRKFVDTVPVEDSLSSSTLDKMADDYMADKFGEEAVFNTFRETICQEKGKVAVSKISIKTKRVRGAGSDCYAVLKICDLSNNCCETGGDDLKKKHRENGQDVWYTDDIALHTCSMPRLVPSGQWTAQLTLQEGFELWVDWVRISAGESTFNCRVSGLLDNKRFTPMHGEQQSGPSTRIVTCARIDNLNNLC